MLPSTRMDTPAFCPGSGLALGLEPVGHLGLQLRIGEIPRLLQTL